MTSHSAGHNSLISKDSYRDAAKWCEEQFGKRWDALDYKEGQWSVFWAGRDAPLMYNFWFTDQKYTMLFILRWS